MRSSSLDTAAVWHGHNAYAIDLHSPPSTLHGQGLEMHSRSDSRSEMSTMLREHAHIGHRSHMAITPLAGCLRALRCHRLLERPCVGIIPHHQARGTDAMSDGTRHHQLFASRLKRQQRACTSLKSHRSHPMAITATVLVACVLYDATACWRGLGIIQHHKHTALMP